MRLRPRVLVLFAVSAAILAAAGVYTVSARLKEGSMPKEAPLPKEQPLPKEVPAHFAISTLKGPIYVARMGAADFHFTRIQPSGARGGEGVFELVEGKEEPPGMEGKSRTAATHTSLLGKSVLLPLYREIVRQGFFALKEGYSDPGGKDGGFETITVTANGKTHRVCLANRSLKETDRILARLRELSPSGD